MNTISLSQLIALLLIPLSVRAADSLSPQPACPPGAFPVRSSSGICSAPADTADPPLPGSDPTRFLLPRSPSAAGSGVLPEKPPASVSTPNRKTVIYFFRREGCPHCDAERAFLAALAERDDSLEIRLFDVGRSREHAGLMASMLRARGLQPSGVPVTFVHDQVAAGFTPRTRDLLEHEIAACRTVDCGDPGTIIGITGSSPSSSRKIPATGSPAAAPATTVTIPFLGDLDARYSSLPVVTLLLAGMDSFNPCAFFVLLSLLGMLVHARTRGRMLLVGGIFVVCSGLVYFLFMAAWLNLFLLTGQLAVITLGAGVLSIGIAAINIKEFFFFKQGVSLSLSESARTGLFDRMRRLLRATSLFPVVLGTTMLAVVANAYELLCTAGFPMIFTRFLTLRNLAPATYYLYLVLYNTVYVVPLFVIVLLFTVTLGRRKLSEREGRIMKLLSGTLMLGLGTVLLVDPSLLNRLSVSLAIVATALGIALLAALMTTSEGRRPRP